MSSRRTRAHPSPSGFRQLEDQPRKRSTRIKSKQTAAAVIAAGEAAAQATVEPSTQAVASTGRRQSPPTATSRSQSENDHDVESDSQNVPESRSTSPPSPSHPLPSTSRSISPPSLSPFTHPFKVAKRTPKATAAAKGRKQINKKASTTSPGRERNTDKSPGRNVLGKHSRTEEPISFTNPGADALNTEESRPPKRTRRKRKTEEYFYNSDSSFDMEELERNPPPDPDMGPAALKPLKKIVQKAKLSQDKRMTNTNNSSQLFIPATSTGEKIVLKRLDIIDAARSLAKWAERDTSNPVPNAEQLEALLESFKAQELAKTAAMQATGEDPPTSETVLEDTHARHRDEAKQPNQNSARLAAVPNIREVGDELQEPQSSIPAKSPEPQESRLWGAVSRVTNIVTSPFKLMNYRGQSITDAIAAANTTSEIPATLYPGSPENVANDRPDPTTPTKSRKRRVPSPRTPKGRVRSPTDSKLPDTARTHKSVDKRIQLREQPGRKKRPLPSYMRETEKNIFYHREPQKNIPIELVGVVSAERIKEIQDKQDREAEDRLAKARSEARQARVEDEEVSLAKEHELQQETLAQAGQKTGEKRKRRSVRTPPPNPPGVFTVPYESSSEEGDSSYLAGWDSDDATNSPVDTADKSRPPTLPFTRFKAPEEAPQKVPAKSPKRSPKKTLEKAPEKASEKAPEPEPYNIFGPHPMWVNPDAPKRYSGPSEFTLLVAKVMGTPIPTSDRAESEVTPSIQTEAQPSALSNMQQLPPVSSIASLASQTAPTPPSSTNWWDQVSSASSNSSVPSQPQHLPAPSPSANSLNQVSSASSNAFVPSKPKQDLPAPPTSNNWWNQVSSASSNTTTPSQSQDLPAPSSNRWWEQQPPEKPKPSNAQLPPQPSAFALANAQKYQPKQPSKLRNVTQMSPLHSEKQTEEENKENAGAEARPFKPFTFKGFAPEIIAAVENIDDSFFDEPPAEVLSAYAEKYKDLGRIVGARRGMN